MRPLQKVLWKKGTILNPQHLQVQDHYLEELLGFHLRALEHAPYGFKRLDIDQAALAAGTLAIRAAEGLLPDGLPFLIPTADAVPPPKALQEQWRPDQYSMELYLGVPEYRPEGRNVAMDVEAGSTRYVAEAVMRRDENTGLSEKPLQLARRNLRLLTETESREGWTTLPVARVLRSETGALQLDPHFVPPLLDIQASGYLLTLARRLVELLAARSSGLAGMRRQRNRGLADFGSSDTEHFWLLYTVNTHLPLIRHLFEVRHGHPEKLYRALLALAGALSTFSGRIHARDLPPYDHDDLGPRFQQLDAVIRELLETVVPINHVVLPLRETGGSVHAVALDDEKLLSAPQLFLGVSAAVGADEVARRVPSVVKVSSGDGVDRLVRQALVGAPLRYLPTPPSRMPAKPGFQYFQIERSGAEWDAIRIARNLAAHVPVDLPEARLELVVLLE